jgi:hypothetical protein
MKMPTTKQNKKKKISNEFTADRDDTIVLGTCEGCDSDYDTAAHSTCPHCRDDRRTRNGRDTDEDGTPLPLDKMMGWFRF